MAKILTLGVSKAGEHQNAGRGYDTRGEQDLLLSLADMIAEHCPDTDGSRHDQHGQHDPKDVLLGQHEKILSSTEI